MFQMRDHSTVQPSSPAKRSLASRASPVHLRQNAGIEIALIERRFAAAHHRRHNPGKSLHDCRWCRPRRDAFRNRPDLKRQFCCRGQRIAPRVHRRRAGVRFLPMKGDSCAAPRPWFPARSPAASPACSRHRPLLDMQFQIRGGVFALLSALRGMRSMSIPHLRSASSSVMPS